jgi:glycerate-2-kinase
LEEVFWDALAAVDAGAALRRAVRARGGELRVAGAPVDRAARLVVLAAGKAAAAMAAALEEVAGPRIAAGLAVAKDGCGLPLARIALLEAGHPIPDRRSEQAAREALRLVESARPDDVLLVLLSGGASSLLAGPAPGLGLEDLARTTAALLAAGAEIGELNAVRKHLSAVAGGRLAERAACRRIEVLALSDVPGDRFDVIGSGPFAPDPTRFEDALAALERRGVRGAVPRAVLEHLEAGARGGVPETPKPGAPQLARVRSTLLASNRTALLAAAGSARRRGWRAPVLEGALRGEARCAGRRLAALARALRAPGPVCLLAGGETSVRVRGPGRGGRSQELALAAALELAGVPGVALLAAGTDGSDGPTDAAGAFVDGGSAARGRRRGRDPAADLAANDSYAFFDAEGGLLRTGPTRTNVMDLALVLVEGAG